MDKELLKYAVVKKMPEKCLNVISKNRKTDIPISTIRYIESVARKLIIHTKADDISIYAKLNDVDAMLAKYGFVRIHQSYLVRISEIKSMGRYYVALDGIEIPISRRYFKDVLKMYDGLVKSVRRGGK